MCINQNPDDNGAPKCSSIGQYWDVQFLGPEVYFSPYIFCLNKMVLEPNVSPHMQIIKDDDVKECISTE